MNERYSERMRDLLGEEFSAYEACLSGAPVRGIRINTLKLTPEAFQAVSPFSLEPVPWEASGFYIEDTPLLEHEAGKYGLILEKCKEHDNWAMLHFVRK